LSVSERAAYLTFEFLDLAYIAIYSLIAFLILGYWAFIPGLIDLGENFHVILHLLQGTNLPDYLGVLSSLKWISGAIMVFAGIQKLRKNYYF
jgi:hypothetical protein